MATKIQEEFATFFDNYDDGEYALDEQAALIRADQLLLVAKRQGLDEQVWAKLSRDLREGRHTRNIEKKVACLAAFRENIAAVLK